MKIAVLPGDGIGTEIVAEAVKVLGVLDLKFEMETALVGGAAYEAHGHPLFSALTWGDPVIDIRAVHTPTYQAALAKIRRRVANTASAYAPTTAGSVVKAASTTTST